MATNNLKHVGQLINTQRRVVVMFREIPDDEKKCLVVDTDALVDWMHDDVINAVESPGAQASVDFAEFAQRRTMTDGTNMLQSLHALGKLQKQATSNVMMTPNRETQIRLDELNDLISGQKGKQTTENSVEPTTSTVAESTDDDGIMNDTVIAENMIAQAKQYEDEAATLRESAYALSPELKPKRGRPAAKKAATA
jgi:hypothetical protein|tara:strand:+ start:3662 stop:4249 length:588 start_codon:yes stop_codon:yes gene_type:complete